MGEITSACVLLFHPETGEVLVEHHASGVGLPGGAREPRDRSPLETAARELEEETGVVLYEARPILTYLAGPHVCQAWHAVRFHEPLSLPSSAGWASPEDLVGPGARFPDFCALMFATFSQRLVLLHAYLNRGMISGYAPGRPWESEFVCVR